MLRHIITRIIPIKVRSSLGLWTIKMAAHYKWLLSFYLYLLFGYFPKDMRLASNNRCVVRYKDRDIVAPRDGALTFVEVLQEEVYEKYHHPVEGDMVLDIGAYVGMFTVKASLVVGERGQVIAIEPSQLNLKYLHQNIGGLGNVRVVPMAVSSYAGRGKLNISGATPCNYLLPQTSLKPTNVGVTTIDDLVQLLNLIKVDYIKIDAEGAEIDILNGALETLGGNNLKLAIASYHELPDGKPELPEICRLLTREGFSFIVDKGYVYADNARIRRGNEQD